jgi:hypothetical protein
MGVLPVIFANAWAGRPGHTGFEPVQGPMGFQPQNPGAGGIALSRLLAATA